MAALENICRRSEKAAELTYDQRSGLLRQIQGELERIKAYIAHQNPALLTPEA
jgi:Ni,Fe-hydrogenase III large subunit